MALTEEQKDVARKVAMGMDDKIGLIQRTSGWWPEKFAERFLAALPKPEAVYHQWRRKSDPWSTSFIFSNEAKATSDDSEVRRLYTEAPIAPPASASTGWDAEFLSKRLGRVAKLAGVSIPENFTHEQVAEAAGTILGQIAAAMEARPASAPSEQKPVAYLLSSEGESELGHWFAETNTAVPCIEYKPLYLAPQPDYNAQRDAERLDFLEREYIKVDSFEMQTGGDDADVGWRLSQYHMGKPRERVVAEYYKDDLRAAIDAAIASVKGGE